MSKQEDSRDKLLKTLTHIDEIRVKVLNHTIARGHRIFNSPDQYKLYEGLFLSAWTHWEQFIRNIMIADLADSTAGLLGRDVKTFRTKNASLRLAEILLEHPDEDKWIEWSSAEILIKRANTFLESGHRFSALSSHKDDLAKLKKIRNAVAHKSDVAWNKFSSMVKKPPFNYSMRGMTVGKFLAEKKWDSIFVLEKSLKILTKSANDLVP